MAKSIHERVRAQLEKAARETTRAQDRAEDKILRAAERLDIEYQRGWDAYELEGVVARFGASAEWRRGNKAAQSGELRELLGE